MNSPYDEIRDGIHLSSFPIQHRHDEYEETGFETLCDMHERHFWYRGRHRFLISAVNRYMPDREKPYSAIDLGGGIGSWVNYLAKHRPNGFSSPALADSSIIALTRASSFIPPDSQRYQIDLMQLHMSEKWDAAFLLDVIEHLPDDLQALREAREALKPGGYLFVTTPAFPQLWSYNDDIALHLRRYRRSDFAQLALQSGLTLCDSRYFMFFLSPLYLLSRKKLGWKKKTPAQLKELAISQHQVPFAPINRVLSAIFAAESPLGHWIRFPWGTSLIGVFKKE